MVDLTVKCRTLVFVLLLIFYSMMMLNCAVISMIGCGGCWQLSWIPLDTLVSELMRMLRVGRLFCLVFAVTEYGKKFKSVLAA